MPGPSQHPTESTPAELARLRATVEEQHRALLRIAHQLGVALEAAPGDQAAAAEGGAP